MKRIIGYSLLIVSMLAGVIFYAVGMLGFERVTTTLAGPIHLTDVTINSNWPVIAPVAAGFVIGLLFVLMPRHRRG